MEKLIKKHQKKNTDVLVNQLSSAVGDDLKAIEVVLVKRGQRNITLTTPISEMAELSTIPENTLEERGYYPAIIEDVEETPAPKKKAKKEKVKKEKIVRNTLTLVEKAILDAIVKESEENSDGLVYPVGLEDLDLDAEIKTNGSRLSGAYKTLIRKGLIDYNFSPALKSNQPQSTVYLTEKGHEFLKDAEVVEARRVKKVAKEFEEEEMEEIEAEFEETKREYKGKVVSFKTNVHGAEELGLVTGAKLDRRSGYIFLNIKVGANRFNKRAKHVEIVDEQPTWLKTLNEEKAAKLAESKAKKEAAKKAREEKAAAKKAEKEAAKKEKAKKEKKSEDDLLK